MRSRILLIFDVLEHFFTSAVSKWKQENQNWEPSFWPMMDVDQKSNWSINQFEHVRRERPRGKTPLSFGFVKNTSFIDLLHKTYSKIVFKTLMVLIVFKWLCLHSFHRCLRSTGCTEIYIKVFCNFIGWVKSANGQNSWMTSLSYARDCAQKVLINPAELLTYSQRQFGKKN